jgi:hypothetical protein
MICDFVQTGTIFRVIEMESLAQPDKIAVKGVTPSPALPLGGEGSQKRVPSPARGGLKQRVPSPARAGLKQRVPSPARGGLGWGEIEQKDTQISYAKLSDELKNRIDCF